MILRRLTANVKAQNWTAITIDFLIVVIGVFLGIQASNWNQARLESRDIDRLLFELQPELTRMQAVGDVRLRYYDTTRRFARTALSGWRKDSKVTNHDFVVGAYQASQITGPTSVSPLATMLDSESIRKIEDPALRSALLRVINFNYDPISAAAMQTRYREDVRETIPADVQDSIRRACGDRSLANGMLVLPTNCSVPLTSSSAGEAAAELRSRPELARELEFHLAQVANAQQNTIWLNERLAALEKLIEARYGKSPQVG